MITVYDYKTLQALASIKASELSAWCEAHGYLPHRKAGRGWVVIAK